MTTLTLSGDEYQTLMNLLCEKAMELADDGREGNPDSKLLYQVARAMRQTQAVTIEKGA